MRVFVTGATGFIGTALVPELLQAGHRVLGLTRSDAGAQSLRAVGAEVHRGTLEDTESLRRGAAEADAVIHLAFDHNFANFAANCEKDRSAIEAIGSALTASRPFLITSATGMGSTAPGVPASEDVLDLGHRNPRIASEQAAAPLSERGLDIRIVRLPQIHNTEKQGLITPYIELAREKGTAAYIGEGKGRWPAAHISDTARLYRLALEKGKAGQRYNAVAEEGVPLRSIAEVIAQGLKIPAAGLAPEQAPAHFGWLAMFAGMDMPASGILTRERLGWTPSGPDLLTDLKNMQYAAS